MNIKGSIIGAVATIVIGGTSYTVSQTDVIKNFASDTGMTQQQAQEYVQSVNEDDLVPYDELGQGYLDDSTMILDAAQNIDCLTHKYEWESATLSCEQGQGQFRTIGSTEAALGQAYKTLASESATTVDINQTITLLDKLISDFSLEVIVNAYNPTDINELKNINSYNKALLVTALESK